MRIINRKTIRQSLMCYSSANALCSNKLNKLVKKCYTEHYNAAFQWRSQNCNFGGGALYYMWAIMSILNVAIFKCLCGAW